MARYKSPMERFIEAAGKTGDIMLRYAYQKQMIMDNLLTDAQLDRVAEKVIERISINADISDIIEALDEIEKRLDKIGGK